MVSRSVYLTDDQLDLLKEAKVPIQEVFRQGFIIETVLQGTNPKLNNDFQRNKIAKLIEFHSSQIEGLQETIRYHQSQIDKLKGGDKDVSNKEKQNN